MRAMMQERSKRSWSRWYVGQRLGVTDEMIRLIEVGKRDPSYPLLCKLEDLFQMNHRDLFREV